MYGFSFSGEVREVEELSESILLQHSPPGVLPPSQSLDSAPDTPDFGAVSAKRLAG